MCRTIAQYGLTLCQFVICGNWGGRLSRERFFASEAAQDVGKDPRVRRRADVRVLHGFVRHPPGRTTGRGGIGGSDHPVVQPDIGDDLIAQARFRFLQVLKEHGVGAHVHLHLQERRKSLRTESALMRG